MIVAKIEPVTIGSANEVVQHVTNAPSKSTTIFWLSELTSWLE
jgi:hypothetical protein